jgi:hypothetical protein
VGHTLSHYDVRAINAQAAVIGVTSRRDGGRPLKLIRHCLPLRNPQGCLVNRLRVTPFGHGCLRLWQSQLPPDRATARPVIIVEKAARLKWRAFSHSPAAEATFISRHPCRAVIACGIDVADSRRGVAQPGRAPGSGPGGRRFKSSLPDQSSPSQFLVCEIARWAWDFGSRLALTPIQRLRQILSTDVFLIAWRS